MGLSSSGGGAGVWDKYYNVGCTHTTPGSATNAHQLRPAFGAIRDRVNHVRQLLNIFERLDRSMLRCDSARDVAAQVPHEDLVARSKKRR
ncbi:MAG: hypothetical protein AAF721_24125 [Myxococcota bacterium]